MKQLEQNLQGFNDSNLGQNFKTLAIVSLLPTSKIDFDLLLLWN